MTIGICPLSRVGDTVEALGAVRVLSLLSESTEMATPPGIDPADHLTIRFHDIVAPLAGHVHPSDAHVAEALAFAAADDGPIVVNCYAGISRSTAMGFAIACARQPDRDEAEIANALREASPSATPNRLIVALADEALNRDGRMLAAIDAIGRGADAFEGAPFVLGEPR